MTGVSNPSMTGVSTPSMSDNKSVYSDSLGSDDTGHSLVSKNSAYESLKLF